MIAIDTNLLIYAHAPKFAQHHRARSVIEKLADSGAPWGVPWPCAHEFCAVMSNKKMHMTALPMTQVLAMLEQLSCSPSFRFLHSGSDHFNHLRQTLLLSDATGGMVHDARIVATCLDAGVSELWTVDRDFARFPGLRYRNPLI